MRIAKISRQNLFDLPPLNSANRNLVKFVFEKEDGLEEAVYGVNFEWFIENGKTVERR